MLSLFMVRDRSELHRHVSLSIMPTLPRPQEKGQPGDKSWVSFYCSRLHVISKLMDTPGWDPSGQNLQGTEQHLTLQVGSSREGGRSTPRVRVAKALF